MATEAGTETATAAGTATKLKLDPPDALQPVAPADARPGADAAVAPLRMRAG